MLPQLIKSRRDDSLHGVRDAHLSGLNRPSAIRLDELPLGNQHAQDLFHEKRIALSAIEDGARNLVGEIHGEEFSEQPATLLLSKWMQINERDVAPPTAPVRATVDEQWPRETHQTELRRGGPEAQFPKEIEQSIVGALVIYQDEVREEPLHIDISDSILDATSEERNALSAPDDLIAYAILNITRSTIFGRVLVHAIDTAENSILQGAVTVARRQRGCMRFCSIVPGSRTPRRYHCQPDLVDQAVDIRLKGQSVQVRDEAKRLEHDRVRPRFHSVRYGQAAYCQLSPVCALEIRRGADDESEMGVFHDLFQPQREANLRARLDDFTPAGMETGIIYVS